MNVRGKNAKEKLTGWLSKGQQAFDTIISDKVRDPDEFFEERKNWITEYHTRFKKKRFLLQMLQNYFYILTSLGMSKVETV